MLLAVALAPVLRGEDAELAQLRAKAEKGNVLAQYNLGLAYAEGKATPKDSVEAYVWLRLAADNGGTGTALGSLVRQMSVDDLAAGRARLEERRRNLPTVVAGRRDASPGTPSGGSAPPAPTEDRFAAMQEELAALRVDKARLTQQLAALQSGAASAAGANTEAFQAKITGLTAALDTARKDLAAALKANEDLTARGKTLLDDRNALQRQLGENALAAKRLTDIEGQLEEARKGLLAVKESQTDIQRSKQELEVLRARNEALPEANQRLERQTQTDADAARQRADAQATVEELKRANADLQAQVVALTGRLAQGAPAAPAAPATAAALAAPISGISEADLTRLKEELGRANSKVEMTVRSYGLLREENERLKAKLAQTPEANPAATAAQPRTP